MTSTRSYNWTHHSVLAFAQGRDPIKRITEEARALVLKARETGWEGPPFNPIYIADMLNIKVEANSSIADARLLYVGDGAKIEFNPQQHRERVRFSIAHELAHLLFPDWHEQVRNRAKPSLPNDDWQLEMLCNLAASEFVLPIGSLSAFATVPSIEDLMRSRREYDVSAEAFLTRVVKVSEVPLGLLVASPIASSRKARTYRVDYFIHSATASRLDLLHLEIPDSSVVQRCTAIGHTDYAVENWITGSPTRVECVGVPGYPGTNYPRVLALVRFDQADQPVQPLRVLHGDIFNLRGSGAKLVCQMVNDRATRWGGGVARQMARRFPEAERMFTQSFLHIPRGQRLGEVIFTEATEEMTIASMIAQEGFGRSSTPRIRYAALSQALLGVASRALTQGENVHLPKIGTGASGGDWSIILEMLHDILVADGVSVTVYELPPKRQQLELF